MSTLEKATTAFMAAMLFAAASGCTGDEATKETARSDAAVAADAPPVGAEASAPVDGSVATDGAVTTDGFAGSDGALVADATAVGDAADAASDADSGVVGDAAADGGLADGGSDATLRANVAYPGAPPTMLHEPFACGNTCLNCHRQGSGGARVTPHPERKLCRQCHLPQEAVGDWVPNTFGR